MNKKTDRGIINIMVEICDELSSREGSVALVYDTQNFEPVVLKQLYDMGYIMLVRGWVFPTEAGFGFVDSLPASQRKVLFDSETP